MPVPVRHSRRFQPERDASNGRGATRSRDRTRAQPQDAPQTDLAALLDTTPDAPVDQLDAHSGAQAAPPAKSDAEFGDISAWTIDGEPQAPGAVLDIDSRPKVRPVFRPSPNTAAIAPGSTTPAEAPSHPNTQTPDQANDPKLDPEPAQTQTARVPPRADPPRRPATSTDTPQAQRGDRQPPPTAREAYTGAAGSIRAGMGRPRAPRIRHRRTTRRGVDCRDFQGGGRLQSAAAPVGIHRDP